jgi:hypothetical protein
MNKSFKEWNELDSESYGINSHNSENTDMLHDWAEERKELIEALKSEHSAEVFNGHDVTECSICDLLNKLEEK